MAKQLVCGRNKRFLVTTDVQKVLFTKEDSCKALIICNVVMQSVKLIAILKILVLLTTLLI